MGEFRVNRGPPTVLLTQISSNAVYFKSINPRYAGTLCKLLFISRPVRSAIVSIGTNAAEPHNPRYKFALYGATKSYNHILSSGLEEWYGDKIDVMTVIPRQTKTKMNPANYLFTGLWWSNQSITHFF